METEQEVASAVPFAPYYDEGGITIYNADCRQVLPFLPKFDLLLTDPPYELDIAQGDKGCFKKSYKKLTSERLQSISAGYDIDALISECRSKCDPFSAFVFCSNKQIPKVIAASEKKNLMFTLLAWHKYNSVPFSHGTWRQDAEWVVHLKSRGAPLNGNADLKSKIKRFQLVANKAHPTQKPTGLVRDYIAIGSHTGQTVLDPFMGSGTTLVAAKLEGRKAIGIEISEKYCEVAVKRLSQQVLF